MSRIVVTGRIPEAAIEKLRAEHEVDAWQGPESISREELLRRVAGADGIVSLLTERVDAELLDAAGPQLKVVANVAVGYDNIDVPACAARGVVATNTPGVLTDATADIALSLILMATRRLGEGERLIRSGQAWKWGMFFLLGSSLQGKTLGIVGMGGIGQATARRAKAFGMDIVYQSRSEIIPEIAAELDARRVDLDQLLAISDVCVIALPVRSGDAPPDRGRAACGDEDLRVPGQHRAGRSWTRQPSRQRCATAGSLERVWTSTRRSPRYIPTCSRSTMWRCCPI